jgi:hypothetical protein
VDNVEKRDPPQKTTTGGLPIPDSPAYTGLNARIHAHTLVDENRTEPDENSGEQARFQILDLPPVTPHIWGVVSQTFGADTASRWIFVHTGACLSTDFRELCTGWRFRHSLSYFSQP